MSLGLNGFNGWAQQTPLNAPLISFNNNDDVRLTKRKIVISELKRLPNYEMPLLSIGCEKLALITLGTLLNAIGMSEFEDGLVPGATAAAYEISQRCRLERIVRDRAGKVRHCRDKRGGIVAV